MASVQDSLVGGVISLTIGVVVTAGIAQVIEPPWDLIAILMAIAFASFFAGFFGSYYAEDPVTS